MPDAAGSSTLPPTGLHLIAPYAAPWGGGPDIERLLTELDLGRLQSWLDGLAPGGHADAAANWNRGDEWDPSPPHVRALHRALAEESGTAMPWITLAAPVHLSLGHDGATLLPAADLALTADESVALLDHLNELLSDDEPSACARRRLSPLTGDVTAAGAVARSFWPPSPVWWLDEPALGGLRLAHPDRAVGRPIEPWLAVADAVNAPAVRRLKQLQVLAQMGWHDHPINRAREQRGEPAANSLWIWNEPVGLPDTGRAASTSIEVATALREAAQRGDVQAWVDAWDTLQARLDSRVQRLTLCGERHALTLVRTPAAAAAAPSRSGAGALASWWRRWRASGAPRLQAAALLEQL